MLNMHTAALCHIWFKLVNFSLNQWVASPQTWTIYTPVFFWHATGLTFQQQTCLLILLMQIWENLLSLLILAEWAGSEISSGHILLYKYASFSISRNNYSLKQWKTEQPLLPVQLPTAIMKIRGSKSRARHKLTQDVAFFQCNEYVRQLVVLFEWLRTAGTIITALQKGIWGWPKDSISNF